MLSLPCASGEEPYSIAMALLDAGIPAARFRIDALDISARALSVHGPASMAATPSAARRWISATATSSCRGFAGL
ncbi:hypothetical protein AWV79_36315 [Cupriavidus sp. UYMMa02A]|nr:hypothetical protein AWV79_36315 [Cupriavidus sp. UYMMa02A]